MTVAEIAASSLRVLLIEDNPADADLIREALDEARITSTDMAPPFVLLHASRLAEGVSLLNSEPIDLVLLDLSLPDSRGLDTFRRLGERSPAVPIVVLSGLDDEAVAVRAVRDGAQDYLVKGQVAADVMVRVLRYAIERARSEEERTQLVRDRAAAEAALRARDELLASITHDLKTPLTTIKGRAQLLGRQIESRRPLDPVELREQLARIEMTAGQMTDLLDALLDEARLAAGGVLELQREPTDLVALARRLIADYERRVDGAPLRLVHSMPELVGMWDGRQLGRVLGNLLDNALKYSPTGGEVQVTLASEGDARQEAWALVHVQDHGLGIPRGELPRIFERFYRASNVIGHIRGTGIGLAGAQQIVEQHGGTLMVDSVEGRGSTFTIRLPLQ